MPSQGSSVASAKHTKRKAPAPPKAKVKKGKKEDLAKTVEVFGTEYGKMMFGDKGRFHLTPAVVRSRWPSDPGTDMVYG
jgi:hypothetical protein